MSNEAEDTQKRLPTPEELEQKEKMTRKMSLMKAKVSAKCAVKRLEESITAFEETVELLKTLQFDEMANFLNGIKDEVALLRSDSSEVVNFELVPATDSFLEEYKDIESEPKKKITLVFNS